MAQIIKIKRSAIAAKRPTVADLALGELAMNTTDGKLFMKKSINGIETIVEVGPTPDNMLVKSGTEFPSTAYTGLLFFRTDLNSLYLYDNATWIQVGMQQVVLDHIGDDSRHLTTNQNVFLDAIDLTFPEQRAVEIGYLHGASSNIQTQIDGIDFKVDAASGKLTQLLSDNMLSTINKSDLKLEWERMNHEYSDIHDKANQLGVNPTYVDNYDTSINTLNGYLASLGASSSEWADVTKDTPMDGETLRVYRRDFYTQRQRLLDEMVVKAAAPQPLTTSNVPSRPIDLTNKQYVDNMDYLNNNPKAGLSSADSTVPVYSDFKFSLGLTGSSAFTLVDRDSKLVVYYATTTPTGKISMFRAYRFSDNENFIFDNDAISATFLNPNERVVQILNIGTNFVVLRLWTETIPYTPTRVVIAKTGGSSRWQDWVFAYDVTSLYSGLTNWSLVIDPVKGDRILQTITYGSNDTNDFIVYDSALTVLRTQRLFTRLTDSNDLDHTGAGRTGGYVGIGYNAYGFSSGFTWNPVTETFHQVTSGYYVGTNSNGSTYGQSITFSLSWSIPRSWIMDGTGTPTNLIPVKSSGARYHSIPDSTWDTEDGGMSAGYGNMGAGNAISVVTDEYNGDVYVSTKGTWTTNDIGAHIRLQSWIAYKTFGYSITVPPYCLLQFTDIIPDGSAWAKNVSPAMTQVIGNQVSFQGVSRLYGSQVITTTFSTTSFNTAYAPNDTLKLDAANAKLNVVNSWPFSSLVNGSIPGNHGTVVKGGNPTVFWVRPGFNIYTASANGTTRTFTDTGYAVPTIPSTLSGISGLSYRDCNTWNGSIGGAAIVWAIVGNSTDYYVAKLANGNWSIVSAPIYGLQVQGGMDIRKDGLNTCYIGANGSVLTESGKWLVDFSLPNIAGNSSYTSSFDTVTNNMRVETVNQFHSINSGKPGAYGATDISGPDGSSSYGYSSTFGYFIVRATASGNAICFMTSKDPTGVGAPFTEEQWYAGEDGAGPTRYEVYLSCEAATGLVAYLSEYPIFLGGYYTKVPTTTLTLLPNAVNYIYATKVSSDRSTVSVTSDTSVLPNSFARMKLAAVTTNATAIVSSEVYSFDGIGLPQQDGNAGKSLKTDGAIAYWGSDAPTNKSVSSSLQLVPTDHGGVINLTSGDVRLPASIQGGFEVTIMAGGTDRTDITITPMSGAGLYWMGDHVGAGGTAGVRTLKAGGWAVLRKIDSLIYGPGVSVWMIYGQGLV